MELHFTLLRNIFQETYIIDCRKSNETFGDD